MLYEEDCITEINSLAEYLSFVKNYSEKSKVELWYRGHRTNVWRLKPNLYRNAKRIKGADNEITVLKYNFVNFKDEFYRLKKEVIDKDLFDISKLNDFQIMFIAQHYGLLTPILDWSTDPLVALFFALDEYSYNDVEFPVIYIFKPGFCNANAFISHSDNTSITEPLCIDDLNDHFNKWCDDLNNSPVNHIPIAIFSKIDFSHRICRQSGKFTFHGAVGPLSYSWSDIVIGEKKFVDAIKINPKAVKEIKEYLLVLDINKKSIYRDTIPTPLDNMCAQIKEQGLKAFKNSINEANKVLLQ
ncbi:FRG domain-containing protein [Clostridium cochlearium]|uniref:FRG domain-containing protein n=1 Tax=Clostridium cochlearium TaxID=1494 RepID=UPI002149C94C|nr:FRG domain-containing protein [Clostridium cochlearium]MCR1971919.1 FRG domain-containing protein [Clostridium cochlearium]